MLHVQTAECGCESEVDYSEEEILYQIVHGINDSEFEEKLIGYFEQKGDASLDEIIRQAKSLEAARKARIELSGGKGEVAATKTEFQNQVHSCK